MNMQDNDMDQLFRAKLDNYEVEPSANVWANISNELGGPAQRKSYVPLLRVAASVTVLVAAGLFFLPKKQVITNLPKNIKLAQNPVVKPATGTQLSTAPKQTNTVAQVTPAINTQPTQHLAAVVNHPKTQPVTVTNEKPAAEPVKEAVPVNSPQLIANVDTKPAVIKPTMPEGPISIKTDLGDAINKPITTNVMAAANTGDAAETTKPIATKKRKVHGLGGFLNTVIGAVDKRDDKIIEFTDTDEGDSVTGINLGIFKVKKQK